MTDPKRNHEVESRLKKKVCLVRAIHAISASVACEGNPQQLHAPRARGLK